MVDSFWNNFMESSHRLPLAINRLNMDSEIIFLCKLLSDFGLVVLIWLVQLVIYPSFQYYKTDDLDQWHSIYTGRITIVVLPLMLSQLVLSVFLSIQSAWMLFEIIDTILVVMTWLSTFTIFVPLHQNIDQNKDLQHSIYKLINYNWIRTFIWSIIFVLNLYKCYL
jgi:hypothetical protein